MKGKLQKRKKKKEKKSLTLTTGFQKTNECLIFDRFQYPLSKLNLTRFLKKKYRLIRVQKVFLDSEFEIKILDILFYLKGGLDFQFWQQLYFPFIDVCGV